MMGARPTAISAAFVLEEGMAIDVLREVVADMAERPRPRASPWSRATPRWSTAAPPTACTSRRPGWA